MAIHQKAPEQHYTTLMAHSGLPYDINPPPHSTDFICKVVGGEFFFLVCFVLFCFYPHVHVLTYIDADLQFNTYKHAVSMMHISIHKHKKQDQQMSALSLSFS